MRRNRLRLGELERVLEAGANEAFEDDFAVGDFSRDVKVDFDIACAAGFHLLAKVSERE